MFGSALGAINLYLITFCLSTFNFGAVQSFVTNLAYGTILVASLLLTLLIPVIQRRIRNFSPLLYFVALSVMVLGIILHATFDYAALGSIGGVVPGPLQMQAALVGPLEIGQIDPATEALRLQAAPLIFGALLLAVVAIFLRLAVGQSSRRSIGPAVAVVLAALVLAAAWLMTRDAVEPVLPEPKTEVAG